MRGFDAERWMLAVLGGDQDLDLFRQALDVRLLPDAGPPSWWSDRWSLLRSALVTPLRMRFRTAPALSSPIVVFDPAAGRERMREYRSFFIERYFGRKVDFIGRGQLRSSSGGPSPWLRWYLFGVLAAELSFLDFSERRYAWWGHVFADMQAYLRVLCDVERTYCFGLYDRRPYVLAAFLARHTGVEVVLVYQNIPLYRNCRHLHLRVPVVLTSRVNLVEADFYREQGIFKPSEILYKSQEFALDVADLARTEPVYDIGFFSSGEWARKGGLYQSEVLAAIREGRYADNEYARRAEEIAEALATYARDRKLTLRIYPHPLERRLLGEQGIEPPWGGLVDGTTVSLDASGENSRRKIYEPRAAVSLQSSFIWERLDLGLDSSFIYEWDDVEKNPFSADALGPYRANLFGSTVDLEAKLDAVFAVAGMAEDRAQGAGAQAGEEGSRDAIAQAGEEQPRDAVAQAEDERSSGGIG